MAKKKAKGTNIPDMSGYDSPRKRKGVRYLSGAEKVSVLSRMRKAFSKVKVRIPA